MAAGRSVVRFIRFGVDDNGGTAREIPISGLTPVGFTYGEEDRSAWQDAVIGFLTNQPTSPIEITGPFSNKAAAGFAASAATPTLSGSHTVLEPISVYTFTTTLALAIHFGIQKLWSAGDPVFGIVSQTATSGYVCSQYTTDGLTYTAKFQPFPGTIPLWGTAIIN